MKTMRSATCALVARISDQMVWKCACGTMSVERGTRPESSESVGATKSEKISRICQISAPSGSMKYQPRMEAKNQAIGVSERRRLSTIFQRPMAVTPRARSRI
ncbi:hypothetical protein D3C80_1071890 [compost metagenome]